MIVSRGIVFIMALLLIAGGLDRVAGNRFELGEEFDNGFHALGPLALMMIGITTFSPLLAGRLSGVVGPMAARAGINPAVMPTLLIPIDTSYYPLAHSMTAGGLEVDFASLVVAFTMGAIVTFDMPVALFVPRQEDREPMALGTIAGLVALPIECFVGGLITGLAPVQVLRNLLPVLLFALLLTLALLTFPEKSVRGFILFGKCVTCLITLTLITGCFQRTADIVWVKGLASLRESSEILGSIAVMLAGAYPMVAVMRRVPERPLGVSGKFLGINETAVAGLLSPLANSVPMMSLVHEMNYRGKVMNFAFAVCAAFTFRDHLGFCSVVASERIGALAAGKPAGGGVAIPTTAVLPRVSKGEKRK